MSKLHAGWPLSFACVLACVSSGSLQAASTTYKLTDLGTEGITAYPPSYLQYYKGPQVDDSGAVRYGAGQTNAGTYHFSTSLSTQASANYSKSGLGLGVMVPPTSWGHDYSSYAGGINAAGTAVGFFSPDTGGFQAIRTAFVYKPGGGPSSDGRTPGLSIIPGAYPGTVAWYALGVNASGMIVGVTSPAPPYINRGDDFTGGRAMLSDGKTTVDLNTLIAPGSGFLLTSSTSINDLGQIAGYALDANDDRYHGYLLTPTPEPGAWAVALAAFGFVGLRRIASRSGRGSGGDLA